MGIFNYLRELYETREAQARELRRRIAQGQRDGYANTGDPAPIPVYSGTPAPSAMATGFFAEEVVGTGFDIALTIDSGSVHRSWLWVNSCAWVTAGGGIVPQSIDRRLHAGDGDPYDNLISTMDEDLYGNPDWCARIPARTAVMVIIASDANRTYQLSGWWIEDR